MPNNLKIQDATVVVRPTSRYSGIDYDEVNVISTIITEGELTEKYFVPAETSLPPHIQTFIQKEGLAFRPYTEQEIMAGTEDILEQAKNGNLEGTSKDSAHFILRSVLVHTPLRQITNHDNEYIYELRYNYKLFPTEENKYDFNIKLPFDGLQMPNGSRIELTVITPRGAKIDREQTKGLDENGANIEEVITQLSSTGKFATEFQYQQDPDFNVRYYY
ncbi:hypothetical protein [Anaerobacillus sp. 1_MG-2023]|uniref:hypothetical protein n=1 Tax=Anaerobacillus sp. 1_MG-2023 TaxID=3062655 RepID=UPI0026E2285F|nr:hypothetical protein [Anaerobacillus sp. 1_MG-2023]MDO6657373.1 hypothetical protein [Anaerobacillus sp. 1_MG-2023]